MTGIRLTRATHWGITAYDKNIELLVNKENVPQQVKEFGGQRELCPTTGREHYQGWITCHGQQRGSVILNWLPGVHLEKAKDIAALKRYCMKDETSAGDRETGFKNPQEYLTMDKALEKLALNVPLDVDYPTTGENKLKKIVEWQFWKGVSKIILTSPALIGLYSQPQMYRAWYHTRSVWLERTKYASRIVLRPQPVESPKDSLQETSADEVDEEGLYD